MNHRIGKSIFIAGVDVDDHEDVDDGDWWSVWPDRGVSVGLSWAGLDDDHDHVDDDDGDDDLDGGDGAGGQCGPTEG